MAIKLTECPRDAMQGIEQFIPTSLKISYLNSLLNVGFDVLDFGSFVSPKAIPQLRDTAEVLKELNLSATNTKLLAIVANERGAKEAASFDEIDILGFPFSVSETFQLRNTKATRLESLGRVEQMQNIAVNANKKLRVYLSMGFGNPYGEDYSPEIVLKWARKLVDLGVTELALSDTTGVSQPNNIEPLVKLLINELPTTEISTHFHSAPHNWEEKIDAAFKAGCVSFDSAIKGFGGCPMAKDELVGNLATENLVGKFDENLSGDFSITAFKESLNMANSVFG